MITLVKFQANLKVWQDIYCKHTYVSVGVIAYIVINIANVPTQYRDLLRNMMIIYYQYNSLLDINEISKCFM